MQSKFTKKRDGSIVPFDISKIQEQINFAVKDSVISPIEYESLLSFGNKETVSSEEIQQNIINIGAQQISIDGKAWDVVVGRADMYDLYRQIYKRTKYDVKDWQDNIKYLVRNSYYRTDVIDFLDSLNKQQIKYIDRMIKDSFDFKMTYAQVEILKSKYLIKNKRGVIEYPIIADITNALIISRGDEHFIKVFELIHNQLLSLATPFKRNLRRPNGNVGSCFIGENIDSLSGLTKAFTDMSFISKEGGGIGWYLGKVRPEETYSYKIVKSNNITKWTKIINDIAVAVNQGGCVERNTIVEVLDKVEIDGPGSEDFASYYETKKIPIHEVKKGDYINSFNIETEKSEFKEVLTTMKPIVEDNRQLKIIFDNGESYITSRTHPTLVKRNDEYIYIKTEEVIIGDITIDSKDRIATVVEIDSNPKADENFIDIEVDGNNNYFCSTNGDLFHVVHNSRPGAITLGLDWWHLDIHSFLDIKSELNGDLRDKAFDIFPQVIVDTWFVEKERADEDVILFNHYEYKKHFGIDVTELIEDDLYKVHQHVEQLVSEGKFPQHKKIRAKDLWKKILWTWIEIGDFYIVNKDKINSSNYLKYDPEGGVAKQVNLCVESWSFTKAPQNWKEESNGEKRTTTETDGLDHACNLLSVVASNLVNASDERLEEVCYYATLILDRSIDEGEMPVLEAKKMSELIRNVGIGFVGMGDMMAYNNMMYDTEEGQAFGEKFIEKVSYYSYKASHKLAKENGAYPLFKPENYNVILGKDPKKLNELSLNGFDWNELARQIREEGGIRNYLLLAAAPNSSTGILMSSTASYLPVYNKEMVQTLDDLSLPIIPKFIEKHLWSYKTKFQYHPRDIIICTDKWQKWIDTGMSMEININPDICKINEISDTIMDRFLHGDLKTVYYSLTINGVKGEGCSECSN